MSRENPHDHLTAFKHSRTRRAHAFTLVELLVVMAIIAVLVSLFLPAARSAIATARSFKCQTSLRSVAFDFQLFADDTLHPPRGNDERELGSRRFRLETFQEAQYQIDEFWPDPTVDVIKLPDRSGRDPMRCVEVPGDITLVRNSPCSDGGVGPAASISYGFNIRLHWSAALLRAGAGYDATLTSSILDGNNQVSPSKLPLLLDVNGVAAGAQDISPVYTGPLLDDDTGLYANRWFPGLRHNRRLNAAFIDGHVESSKSPASETSWAWDFTPGR
jgi:prepilin-type N-terminal cleavage/methylation domain-containing protein/prepilin-type processing-associated H-X9-DG protein